MRSVVLLRSVASLVRRITLLTRPQIAAQAAAYTMLGAFLGPGLAIAVAAQVAIAALVVGLIVSFGFVINDYADLEIDRFAKPDRPLPAGMFTRSAALQIAIAIAALGLGVALALQPTLFAFACGNVLLTALYALVLKRTVLLGNAAVALLNSSILLFGALAGGGLTPLVLAVSAMSLLYTLAQEVLYTVDDLEGDQAAGLVTTAVFFGARRALLLFQWLMALAMVAAFAPLWLEVASPLYLVGLLICTVGPVVLRILPLVRQGTPQAVGQACALVKIVRLTSLIPLILLQVQRL